jgi:hypothetical protein
MAKQKKSKARKPKARVDYGQTYWLWFGDNKRGVWVPDPVGILEGIGCKNGGIAVDPNTLKPPYPGKSFLQLLIVGCRPPKQKPNIAGIDCAAQSCYYELQDDGTWQPIPGLCDCNGTAPLCMCNPPQPINPTAAKLLLRLKGITNAPDQCVRPCLGPQIWPGRKTR